MNQVNRKAIYAGITLALAGTTLAAAQDATSLSEDTVAGSPVLIDTSVPSNGVITDLPEIIAGPFQNGNQAYYLLESSTWELSEAAAQARLGAHLVTVNNAGENSFIRSSVLNFDGNDRNGWIGFTDRAAEGIYLWANNEPIGYTNWQPGEPNGGTGQNYAGMVQGSSAWFDLQDNWGDLFTPMFGVIEVDIPSVEAGPFYYNGHTYYLLGESNRHQADTAARLLGGHLVTLDNPAELGWVRANVIQYDGAGRHAWLGLSDEHYDGIYQWDNDSMSTYRPWITNEPNGGTAENYVIMHRNSNAWFDAAHDWGTAVHGVVEVASPNPCRVDMNNDGELDFFDVSEFLGIFGTGCP